MQTHARCEAVAAERVRLRQGYGGTGRGRAKINSYHTRRGEYGVSRTEAPERKASKKYPKPGGSVRRVSRLKRRRRQLFGNSRALRPRVKRPTQLCGGRRTQAARNQKTICKRARVVTHAAGGSGEGAKPSPERRAMRARGAGRGAVHRAAKPCIKGVTTHVRTWSGKSHTVVCRAYRCGGRRARFSGESGLKSVRQML